MASILKEKDRDYEAEKMRAVEAVVEEAEERFARAMEDVEEKLLVPAPATHAVLTASKAGEAVYQIVLVPKTLFRPLVAFPRGGFSHE